MNPIYVQIFSMTDHAIVLQGRYQGPYHGNNALLQTSEIKNDILCISEDTQMGQQKIQKTYFDSAHVILAYRHSDTGILQGTSETLFSIKNLPWKDMPGLNFLSVEKNKDIKVQFWNQEMNLQANKIYRLHFGKTVVYVKNFGEVQQLEWTSKILAEGPTTLHSLTPDQTITIAPPSGSGIQVKMGQEIQNLD